MLYAWSRPARVMPVPSARSVAAGVASRDLLDDPGVAVGIGESAKRPVARALGVGTRASRLDREWRAVPDVGDLDAAADEFGVCGLDVGDDQSASGPAGRGR